MSEIGSLCLLTHKCFGTLISQHAQVLNMSLRNTLAKHKYEQDTLEGRGQQGEFSATIGAINSGLKKLATHTPLSHGLCAVLPVLHAYPARRVQIQSNLTCCCLAFCLIRPNIVSGNRWTGIQVENLGRRKRQGFI